MKVVIPDDYQHVVQGLPCFSRLKDFEVEVFHDAVSDIDTLAQRFASADALVLTRERTLIDDTLLARLPRLKLISQTGKVAAHIDVDACHRRGVAITEGTGSPVAPAELTWALIMTAMRKLVPAVNAMQQGRWQVNIGDCLAGKTLGIWGFGKIGQRLARYATAFDMKVLVWGSEGSRQAAEQQGLNAACSKAAFFADSDVLSLQLRLNADTIGLVRYEDLIRMKPEALFVNTSRAELVEEGALQQALQSGRPGRAALDVYEREPVVDPDYWALKMDNVLCSPHLGYVESSGYELYFDAAFRNVVEFFAGGTANILNPQACFR
ncbi:D-2-hydroxyacid dehydrogenase family protein [Marinobacterium rhizophilum]|uniref:D-2-hydroxyacid dehydrogenase family protein n=1 Tax=Marinobacterium rhizophilum TaxID=420402 RepID=A0ABY5HN71_9GAMM|nr:D-2-hydroxyacid dehydrogenase family protein [Marinobacterium rhizophilum]UTW13222.1 D-2-hydroxyacid dehydrogenase family protein [Marinobacterium rhizophilum]